MRCVFAKTNPVLMDKAIAHYLNAIKRKESPVFHFMSLYSDNEPYPLPELIECLNERIDAIQKEFKKYPTEDNVFWLSKLKRKREQLNQLLK